ncbi:putative capsid and scaffold [Pseudomonas phage vB_PA45_GUMS]|uniref:DNA methyltransferase n=4 Tax=Viruses TaxID=10239 RepID=A0AAT9TST6_9VIRU|nr:DNA methyltransferase [Pseudomonas phage vB_PaeM_C2-10_Ab02]YP_010764795.1 putative capsid and scaffold [Pseudomonas phage vB_PA45_GUMS]QGK90210.1 putative capsid and scaffold [Pseudomonas phage vB_PA45_GUMS]CEF88983.1 putative capsid and scaffold [Pseudomonas phage vB_PaeM_C2-10_Ab02]
MLTLESVIEALSNAFGAPAKSEEAPAVEVTKSLDNEKRMALFVVLEPQEGDSTTDLHADTYSEEEVEKACINFNTHCNVANIFHKIETQEAEIVQSFIAPSAFTTDDGREIKKGTWLQWWHFPEGSEVADALWEGVKSGEFTGVSIGARATVEDIE